MSTRAEADSALRRIEDVRELLELADLTQIVTYALSAKRVQNQIETMDDAEQELQAQTRYDGKHLEARFALRFHAPNVDYFADIGGIFETPETVELADNVVPEFLSKIGVMAVFPYLREAVSGLGARLGAQVPVIGLLRLGDITFSAPDGSDPT
ncbi:SecB-like chaperone SecBL [Isoptericola halotolerans]|uniref:Uncharacterized protein n=1 Tax=Isoptericola halotolerans TaxID=300560 RepID=A0ABX2A387_9MICO|nr:hypothetical protein [Isoptericola halotolerans]NOV97031.1 hypothetical protein [Isoptericola halotolerans]